MIGAAGLAIDLASAFDGTLDIPQVPADFEVGQNGARGDKSFMEGPYGAGDEEAVQEQGSESLHRPPHIEVAGAGEQTCQKPCGAWRHRFRRWCRAQGLLESPSLLRQRMVRRQQVQDTLRAAWFSVESP